MKVPSVVTLNEKILGVTEKLVMVGIKTSSCGASQLAHIKNQGDHITRGRRCTKKREIFA
jgi:hypothetical protein